MNNINEILDRTMSQMDMVFTSNNFAIAFVKNGGRQMDIDKGNMLYYLRNNAQPYGNTTKRVRTWCKKSFKQQHSVINFELNEQECIDFLHSLILRRLYPDK